MNNSKSNGSCRWLVPYLGRKVRQLRREESTLRSLIAGLLRQVRELDTESHKTASVANFWQSQSNKYFDDLIAAHKKIGGLKCLLESNGVEVPEHLK